jgi:MFS family permease
VSIKAILAGTVFDFISTFLVSVVLEVLMVLLFHVPLTDVNTNNPTNVALVLNLVVGLAGDFGGGYVAGRIGRQDPVLNALLTGAVGLLLAAAFLFFLPPFLPWWYTAAALLLIVPAAYAGGTYAAAPTTRRR